MLKKPGFCGKIKMYLRKKYKIKLIKVLGFFWLKYKVDQRLAKKNSTVEDFESFINLQITPQNRR